MPTDGRPALIVKRSTVLGFDGDQALWFLDQLITNQVESLGPGRGAEALLLTPKGRIASHLHVVSAGQVLMRAPYDRELLSFFQGKVFATRVSIEDVTERWTCFEIVGHPDEVLTGAGLPVPGDEPMSASMSEGLVVFRYPGEQGACVLAGSGRAEAVEGALRAAGAQEPASEDAVYAAAGAARFGVDFGPDNLPQEAAMERAVHFSKGCYLGQEAVAMAQRGRVKRRLRHLHLEAPTEEREVVFEGPSVGTVTTMGERFAIAMISTDIEEGSAVKVGGVDAIVHDLPGTDRGPGRPSARELRERLTSER